MEYSNRSRRTLSQALRTDDLNQDKSQTTLNHGVSKARSAGCQPAVAQIFNLRIAPTANGLPNEIRRYSRLKTCATSLRIRIAPESL